ncbi:unnamed protein product [Rotaria magnacalcarata]|uniref:Kinesin light chain n=1 Tax=Rotaria magnacalcarata TaxID=392030 RepID=A0A816BGB7_9BILA|nr:unnamed protein product [Rotaria magnacalcarata]
MGEYSKALEFYEKSHQILEISLTSTHPNLAISCMNFAVCYEKMGDYEVALKALRNAYIIQEKTFQEDYLKALDYFEKCLAIRERVLPEDHPTLAINYNNIGDAHRLMGDYDKALAFYQKASNIQENVKCSPLDCATTYVNLGETYREMKEYLTALTYFQKGLKIREEKLPKSHPDLAVIYHNMSKLYLEGQKYCMTTKYVQQVIAIGQEKLSSTHPHLLAYGKTFGKIRTKEKNIPIATLILCHFTQVKANGTVNGLKRRINGLKRGKTAS